MPPSHGVSGRIILTTTWAGLLTPTRDTTGRYKTDVEEAIEDLPIERKVEMYRDMQRQVRPLVVVSTSYLASPLP